tara:strand:- start:2876 stop:4348 length:1473 start_codon:yes stop_codon:yes gene_type:complete
MKNKFQIIILSVFTTTLIFFALNYFNSSVNKNPKKTELTKISPEIKSFALSKSSNPVLPEELDFTNAAEKTVNSVVHISSEYEQNYNSDPMLDFFWGPGGSRGIRPQIATGSGVIISNDGYIVTNNHVIEDANKIIITLNDGRELEADIIGSDPSTDLALLKIDDDNLAFAEFGNSDDVHLGDWVLAVGNPFNLTSTVTAGIVSAKSRNINILRSNSNESIFPLESFIQTDAAVNPGNSGGALVSPDGLLIGINTAIASKTGSYSGYSFAIPSNIVLKVVNDLKNYGIVQRAFIGVIIQDVSQEKMNNLNLPNTNGVLVSGLVDEGAAVDAGIEIDDVILKVENIVVNDVPELQEQIGKFKPGDKIKIIIRRDREIILKEVTLRNENGNTKITNKKSVDEKYTIFGATFSNPSPNELRNLNITNGVKVENLKEGKLKNAGLNKGFIITHVDKIKVLSRNQLIQVLKSKKGGVLIEGINSNGIKSYFGFGL